MGNDYLVQLIYIAYYGRPADPAGLVYWRNELEANGGDPRAIMDAFGNSEEFVNRFGNLSSEELVGNLYQQIFGRSADQAGLEYYTNLLNSGESSLGQIALDIANGARNDDATVLEKRIEVADAFTDGISDQGLIYEGSSIDEASRLIDNVDQSTDVQSYIDQNVTPLLDSLPPVEDGGQGGGPTSPPDGSGEIADLAKGDLIYSMSDTSVTGSNIDGSQVLISADQYTMFETAHNALFATSDSNFGTLATYKTDEDTLEFGIINFIGESALRNAAREVGYEDWVGFAFYNGELVLPQTVGVSPDVFFHGDFDILEYYGFNGPYEGDGVQVSRPDGQEFVATYELYNSLGPGNELVLPESFMPMIA